MFESLQDSLSSALRTLSGKGKLSESNMRDGLELVKRSLLEADVSFSVVKDFIAKVSDKALGESVLKSLNPTHQVVSIVNDELIALMGPVDHSMHLKSNNELSILMLCGLQGSGKTTTCGKLGRMLKEKGKKPLLVAADLQRPAAIDQLHVIGDQLGISVFSDRSTQDPVKVCREAVKQAKELGCNVIILDTAGRLHIDDTLMNELKRVDQQCEPQQVYLVVDGMTGQDAVNSAKAFNEALELDGVIMTKLDGDARGGAALSVKQITGVPIKFIGTGEHLDALEEFHPERMAGRILGQGDMMSMIELAQKNFDQDEMAKQQEKLAQGEFTLEDFRKQMKQIAKPGLLQKMLSMMPGMGALREIMNQVDEKSINRLCGIVDSMTMQERRNPKIIDQSRRRRIAAGAGCEPHAINEIVKQFEGMRQMMQGMANMNPRDQMRMAQQMQSDAMTNPMGMLKKQKIGTGKRLTTQEKLKLKKERERELRKRKREGKPGAN